MTTITPNPETPPTEEKQRVFRPLGLTIGLIGIIPLFGIEPLIWFYIAYRLNSDAGDFISGGLPLDNWRWAAGIAGVAVIITAILAWIGKPRAVQFLVQVAVIASFTLSLVGVWVRIYGECAGCLVDGATQMLDDIFRCKIPIQIAALLYFLWYINRAPSRAFFTKTPLTPWEPDE